MSKRLVYCFIFASFGLLEPGKASAKQTIITSCLASLRNLATSLRRIAESHEVVPKELRPEFIRNIGDAGIYRRGGQLIFLRLTGLDATTAETKQIPGDELDSDQPPRQVNGKYIVWTKRGTLRYLTIWNSRLEKVQELVGDVSDQPIRELSLPNQVGSVFYNKRSLVIIAKPILRSLEADHGYLTLGYRPTDVEKILEVSLYEGPPPLLAVKVKAYGKEVEVRYLDYSLSTYKTDQPQMGDPDLTAEKVLESHQEMNALWFDGMDSRRPRRTEPREPRNPPEELVPIAITSEGEDWPNNLKFVRVGEDFLVLQNLTEPFGKLGGILHIWRFRPANSASPGAVYFYEEGGDTKLKDFPAKRAELRNRLNEVEIAHDDPLATLLKIKRTDSQLAWMILPKNPSPRTPEFIPKGEEVFRDSSKDPMTIIFSDERYDASINIPESKALAYRYSIEVGSADTQNLVNGKGPRSLHLRTNYKIKSFSRTHSLFDVDASKNLLFAEVDGDGVDTPHTLIIDLESHQMVSIPRVERVTKLHIDRTPTGYRSTYNSEEYHDTSYVILAKNPENSNQCVYTVWNAETRQFYPHLEQSEQAHLSHVGGRIDTSRTESDNYGARVGDTDKKPKDSGEASRLGVIPTSLKNIEASVDHDLEQIRIQAKNVGPKSDSIGIFLPSRPLEASKKTPGFILLNPLDISIQGKGKDSQGLKLTIGSGGADLASIKDPNAIRHTETSEGNQSSLLLQFPRGRSQNTPPSLSLLTVDGVPDQGTLVKSKVRGQGDRLEIRTQKTLLGAAVTGEFSIPLDPPYTTTHTIFNLRSDLRYQDQDIIAQATGSIGQQRPMLILEDPRTDERTSLNLDFDLTTKKDSLQASMKNFLALLMGQATTDAKSTKIENRNPIQKIERDGDLLIITTASGGESGPLTFLYSLRDKKIIFAVPNLQRSIKIGNYLYFIGQASANNRTIVVQLGADAYQYVNHYDLGSLPLDLAHPTPIEADTAHNRIQFHMGGNITRVFDLEQNNFLGLLPKDVQDQLQEAEESLGSVVNRSVFENPPRASYGRTEFQTRLRQAFPLRFTGTSRHTLIIGERGVGTSHELETYMDTFISGNYPDPVGFKPVFFRLDPGKIEGAGDSGIVNAASRKFKILKTAAEALAQKGYRLVVVVDGLERISSNLQGREQVRGWDPAQDIYMGLARLMEENLIDVVSTTTPDGYSALLRTQHNLMSRFANRLDLAPMSREQTAETLRQYLKDRKVECSDLDPSAIDRMLIHLEAWSPMRHFPGSAFEVIDDVLGRVGEKMTYQDLIEGVARKTGVPSLLVNQGILDKVQTDMLNYLNQRVIGQPEPIKRLVAGIMAFAHGINRRDMPIISLMFPGPTGVGKTEVARALSEFLFGDHKRLLIINGEAYSAPPGSGDIEKLRNTIIEHIERYPFNIIVPDEFEKMHPDYQAVILSLGDGKMTDSLGRSVKSNLSIILTTTNIGSEKIRDLRRTIGFTTSPPSAAEVAETFHREAEKGFRPEVVGRFDGIIPFNPINREMGESIIKQYLVEGRDLPSGSIQHRLGLHNIHLEFDQSVYDFMLANYISFEFGARKLAKNIEQDFVQGFLTLQMNQGLKPGGRYKVSHDGKGYKLTGL